MQYRYAKFIATRHLQSAGERGVKFFNFGPRLHGRDQAIQMPNGFERNHQ